MTYNNIVIGLAITSIILVTKEIVLKNMKRNNSISTEIKQEMKDNNLEFDKARDNVLTRKIATAMKIDKDVLHLTDTMTVKQGDRVSLTTDKYGFVTGEFVGTKKVQAEGYTEILIIKFKDGKILQAPLEYIRKDSIMVYER